MAQERLELRPSQSASDISRARNALLQRRSVRFGDAISLEPTRHGIIWIHHLRSGRTSVASTSARLPGGSTLEEEALRYAQQEISRLLEPKRGRTVSQPIP